MSNGGGGKYFEDLVNYCRENAVHSHFINMEMHVMYLKHEILLYEVVQYSFLVSLLTQVKRAFEKY